MALSTLLRRPALTSSLSQQLLRLHTDTALQCRASVLLPIKLAGISQASTTPITNAVRKFQTSAILREKAHDHSKLWVIEKGVSAALIPLIPLGLMMPNKVLDSVIAILICAHTFWGLEAIAVDYVRAAIFGPLIPKIAIGFVYLLSIATLGGLFYIISHDIGIANSIRQFWSIKSNSQKA